MLTSANVDFISCDKNSFKAADTRTIDYQKTNVALSLRQTLYQSQRRFAELPLHYAIAYLLDAICLILLI